VSNHLLAPLVEDGMVVALLGIQLQAVVVEVGLQVAVVEPQMFEHQQVQQIEFLWQEEAVAEAEIM
jgi:hypothetical protein